MLSAMISLPELIAELGGATAIAGRRGITPAAVTNWVIRGQVAAEHRIALWGMAVDAGLDWRPDGADGLILSREAPPAEESEAA